MNENFSIKNIDRKFIKGTCIEFRNPIKINDRYSREYIYSMDDFLQDEFIMPRIKEAGITHLFLQVCFYHDDKNPGHLTLKTHIEQSDENVQNDVDWEKNTFIKWKEIIIKVKKAGIVPNIKIMNDLWYNDNLFNLDDAEVFFSDYLKLTKDILNGDENNHYVEIITIANETYLIRNYAKLRSNWRCYINALKEYRNDVKISMSQYLGDIVNGVCDITDLVDIIGINYYPAVPEPDVPGVEDVIRNLYSNDIYVLQQYCIAHNKKFLITEYGCSCWKGQAKEPEQGNSMVLYYADGGEMHNYLVQANYLQGGCIVFLMIKECIGLSILGLGKGGNYDWAYKCNIDTKSATENIISYSAVKAIWGAAEAVYNQENKIWIEEEKEKYLIQKVIEGGEYNE